MIKAFAWRLLLESARSEPEAFQVKPEDQFQSLQAYQQSLILPSCRVLIFYVLHHLPMHHTILGIVKSVRSKALSKGYLPAQETFLPWSIQMLSLGILQRADQRKKDHKSCFQTTQAQPFAGTLLLSKFLIQKSPGECPSCWALSRFILLAKTYNVCQLHGRSWGPWLPLLSARLLPISSAQNVFLRKEQTDAFSQNNIFCFALKAEQAGVGGGLNVQMLWNQLSTWSMVAIFKQGAGGHWLL